MNPKPEIKDPTVPTPWNEDAKPQPSPGPLKNEPTPERAAQEKHRQEEQAEKQK